MTGNAVPKVAVILLNYNGWIDTIECLESVLRLQYDNFRIIIADNNSINKSVEHIKLWADGKLSVWQDGSNPLKNKSYPPVTKPIEVIEYNRRQAESVDELRSKNDISHSIQHGTPIVLINSGGNLGFAGGNNVAIRYTLAKGDFQYIWLLNNDTVVNPDTLTKLVERIRQKSDAGICGSTIRYYHRPDKIQALAGARYNKWLACSEHIGLMQNAGDFTEAEQVEKMLSYVTATSMLVSIQYIEKIGLMCEDYFLYFEEIDWILRAKGRFSMVYAPNSVVYHKEGGTIGSSSIGAFKSRLADYYGLRNRIVFTKRFFPYALPVVYLGFIGVILNRIRRKQCNRIWMIIKILFSALFKQKKTGENPSEVC